MLEADYRTRATSKRKDGSLFESVVDIVRKQKAKKAQEQREMQRKLFLA